MYANAWRWWLGCFVLTCAVLGVATCGNGPTIGDATPTPTPQSTVILCTAAQSIQSFRVDPATVTEGDAFTLRWEAPCGYVSLAQQGKAQFALNQPSSGSYQLRSGANGYPTATGDTVYEAANGDLATRVYATVTVTARATPTPAPTPTPTPTPVPLTVNLTPVAGTTCHPQGNVAPSVGQCHVDFTASGSGYTALAWSGCCASSSGTTGQCLVPKLKDYTCTVTATGASGNATANATATGVNTAPTNTYTGIAGDTSCGGQFDVNFGWSDADGDMPQATKSAVLGGNCTILGEYFNIANGYAIVLRAPASSGGGDCRIKALATDGWVESAYATSANISACP